MSNLTQTADRTIIVRAARARAEREQRFGHLWRLTREQRVSAMWRGELTLGECFAWAARRPHEVPLIGNEYAFIVAREPDFLGPDG